MTSQKSSVSTFTFTFLSALKGNFVLPLLNLFALIATVPVSCVFAIKGFTGMSYDPKTGAAIQGTEKITDLYKYIIFNEFGQISGNVFLHLSVIAFSILLGVVMFRFIAGKKTVNVYYSLGITRKNLFASKYLAGILMLSVSIALPFLACLVINISTFGSSKELWAVIIYYILGYCALSFTAFSLTAAVFSCVGTIVEGVTFSGILMLGPTMVFYGIQFLMNKLTLGSPYGHFYDADYRVTNSLAAGLARYNPILFLFNQVSKIGMLSRESTESKFVFEAPNYANTIIWFAVAVALFFAGIYLFQKRKAEICGFLGVNKPLNFVITFLIGFFSLTIAIVAATSVLAGILIGVALFVVLYAIIDFALIRNLKEWAKGLVKLPVHLGVALLIVLIFATGLFGYSSRIPRLNNIESVDITPMTSSGVVNPLGYGGYGDGEFVFTYGINTPITGFKSARDLETITQLHRKFIDAGKVKATQIGTTLPVEQQVTQCAVRITYHLKNGNSINRFYGAAAMETLTAMLAIDEADRYRELIKQNLTEPATDSDSAQTKEIKNIFQSPDSAVSIFPNRLNTANDIKLTPALRAGLLSALVTDLTAQTAKDRFFPQAPAIGAIQFYLPGEKPKDAYEYIPEMPVGSAGRSLTGYGSASIILTKDMTATLGFLDANGLTGYFDNDPDTGFVSAQVISAAKLTDNFYYYGADMSFHFVGGWSSQTNDYGNFGGAYKTDDKTVVDEMALNAHISYFNSVAGYFVKFELANGGGFTTLYVPADKMPRAVVDAVAKHIQIRPDYPMEKFAY